MNNYNTDEAVADDGIGIVEVATEDMVDRHAREQGEIEASENYVPPKKRWAFDFQQVIDNLLVARENVQVTFFHRVLYQLDDPRILIAIHERLTRKLAFMGIVPANQKTPNYDTDAIAYAANQYEAGNPKFYSGSGSEDDS